MSNYFLSIKNLIGVAVSVFCLYIISDSFNWISFFNELSKVNVFYLLLSIICLFFSLIVRALRWKSIFHTNKIKLTHLYKAEIVGFWGNSIFPLRMGELIKIHYSKILTKKKYSYILGTIIIERLIDILLLAPIVVILYYFFPLESINSRIDSIFIIILAIICISTLFIYIYKRLKINLYAKIEINLISNFRNNFFILCIYSSIIWILIFLNVYFIQLSMHLKFSLLNCLLIVFVATIIYAIPSAPGTIGSFHLGIQELLINFLGCSIDTSIAFAFILHAHSYLFFIIIGSYYFLRDSDKILSFKENL